ncbi:DUF3300 domain-containing protein [Dechloromonas denitrificans]|nr:DUF3300 domain-containing protein [Dechloromonas denitrificans]
MPSGIPRLVAVLVSGSMVISGCTAAPPAAPPPTTSTSSSASAPNTGSLSQAQLEQLLAPVALYPDALLAQILMASTYPLEVVEAARWSKANPEVKDKALEDAMQKQAWDPSVKSLTAFPQVLQMMNEKLSWTQQLGDAFLADQQRVMKSVQKLRKAANDQGNLKSSKEQNVVVEQGTSETIIKIEPADPAVVYVPTYNPTVVYGAWPYAAYPPYAYYPPGYVAGAAFWSFTAGVIVGSALWGGCNWGGNNVYINHNNYNNFNRTNISGNNNWSHNAEHRRGVSYKDQRVAQQYNRGTNSRDAQAREQFRGHAEAGRSELGQRDGAGNRASTADRSGPANRDAARPGGGRDSGPSAGTSDISRGGRDGGPSAGTSDMSRGSRDGGPSAGTSDMSRGGRDSAGSRDVSGSRQASGFGGADHGRQANDFGSRGASSRQSSSFGGGGFSGGGRAGGGGRGGRR